ncbi:hypothetical protein HAX54_004275 [Datura stramonium]|uniref:Uncharacterized protein n=1 Tax=Datura stramonium TaxID=4076 RepID=A0ABS8T6Q3_DATST|nr:hypothetical protein [Datura stramonium]
MVQLELEVTNFFINDNVDVLIEILQRVDGGSLGVAACVCVRTVVLALGGYKRLYMVCVKPVLDRLRKWKTGTGSERVWTQHEVELSLSLFCVDYYERVFLGGGAAAASSLMFLCNAVNV